MGLLHFLFAYVNMSRFHYESIHMRVIRIYFFFPADTQKFTVLSVHLTCVKGYICVRRGLLLQRDGLSVSWLGGR